MGQRTSRGSVIRTHVIPANPQTPKQQEARRKFAEMQTLAKLVANPVAELLGYKYRDKSAYNAWISYNMKKHPEPLPFDAIANLSISPTINRRMNPWFYDMNTALPRFLVTIQGMTMPWKNIRSWGFLFCPETGMFVSGPGNDVTVAAQADRDVQAGHTLYGGGFFYGDALRGLGITWGPIIKTVKT